MNIHLAEIVRLDFALMMSQFTFNRPPLRIDTGGGDADLSLYADHVLSIYCPLHSLRLAPTMPCISLVDVTDSYMYLKLMGVTMFERSCSPKEAEVRKSHDITRGHGARVVVAS